MLYPHIHSAVCHFFCGQLQFYISFPIVVNNQFVNSYRIAGKFGSLLFNYQIKNLPNLFPRVHVCTCVPHHQIEIANSVKNVVWGKATKFDDHQYFWLYTVYTIFVPLLFTTQIVVLYS